MQKKPLFHFFLQLIFIFSFFLCSTPLSAIENYSFLKGIFIYQIETGSFQQSNLLIQNQKIVAEGPQLESPILSNIIDASQHYITPMALAELLNESPQNNYYQQLLALNKAGALPIHILQQLFPKVTALLTHSVAPSLLSQENTKSYSLSMSSKHMATTQRTVLELKKAASLFKNTFQYFNQSTQETDSNTEIYRYPNASRKALTQGFTLWNKNPFQGPAKIENLILNGNLILGK